MPRPAVSHPLSLLLLVTALVTFLIQSGELGTSDTAHRLQVTHSLWTGEPQVFPYEYPDFGLHGRGGRLYASYGIGQSLIMLPADLASTAASHLPLWRSYVDSEADPTIRSILVSISTNVLITVLTALAACRLLGLLGFSMRESICGTLGLLLATTHLHYAQNMTENNYILLLTITGFALQYRWLTTGDRRSLLWGSIALGLNLLTRITTTLDILGAACFLLLAALFARYDVRPDANPQVRAAQGPTGKAGDLSFSLRVRIYLRTALPVYAVFFFIDRAYQYIRFGSWTNTYVAILAREQRQMDPTLPLNFPFDGHWFQGGINSSMLGPLLAPEKTIFLFDPMFPLTLLFTVLLWKRLAAGARAFLAASLVLLVSYIAFYARYDSWAGDYAWGDRYISSSVELVTLLAIPLLLRYRQSLRPPVWYLALFITVSSAAVQGASVAFWFPLEIYQMKAFGHPTWVVLLRLKNIAAFVLGQREAWRLNTPAIYQDAWDAAHLTTWNFLPSLLHQVGAAPLWAVHILDCVWFAVALVLVVTSAKLVRALCRPDTLPKHQSMDWSL
jgi:hypothetical protein